MKEKKMVELFEIEKRLEKEAGMKSKSNGVNGH